MLSAGYPETMCPDARLPAGGLCRESVPGVWSADKLDRAGSSSIPALVRPREPTGTIPTPISSFSGRCWKRPPASRWPICCGRGTRAARIGQHRHRSKSGHSGTGAACLHSERKGALGIPESTPFYEEATFWNPAWTLAPGAITTSDIADLTTTAIAWGTGALLSPASHAHQLAAFPVGFGAKVEGCRTAIHSTQPTTMRWG